MISKSWNATSLATSEEGPGDSNSAGSIFDDEDKVSDTVLPWRNLLLHMTCVLPCWSAAEGYLSVKVKENFLCLSAGEKN